MPGQQQQQQQPHLARIEMLATMQKTSLRASSRPQAFKSGANCSRAAAFAPARPAVQKLAVRCQAGVAGGWSGSRASIARPAASNVALVLW